MREINNCVHKHMDTSNAKEWLVTIRNTATVAIVGISVITLVAPVIFLPAAALALSVFGVSLGVSLVGLKFVK